jgi:hypothetical protein
MCSLIPEGGRDLGCFVMEGTSSGLLVVGVVLVSRGPGILCCVMLYWIEDAGLQLVL